MSGAKQILKAPRPAMRSDARNSAPASGASANGASANGRASTVYLVSSSGGHLDLLTALDPALDSYKRVWVTSESSRADAIEAAGQRVERVPFYGRNPLKLIGHLRKVIRLVRAERPKVVISSGAGTAVPFCILAWFSGSKLIFIETMARVTNGSVSGRILSRLAAVAFVQWPEMLRVYPRARLCAPVLLGDVRTTPPRERVGTFVAVGTRDEPFDRLIAAVERAAAAGVLPAPAHGQCGSSVLDAPSLSLDQFLPPERIAAAVADARFIVCHAGSGMIAAALRAGRRPLVMPRLRQHGEHVDDHQLQLVEKLGDMGLVVPLEGEITAAHLAAADEPLDSTRLIGALDGTPVLEEAIGDAIVAVTGQRKTFMAPAVEAA
jgi:UDP-N-acetylglucosamine--N-acetylmuramyl-(pentapeptide) pyrophosphoryl-undecaprenol N-acetylglucosamine transferase